MNGFLNWKIRNISFTSNNLSYIIYMKEYTVYVHKNLKNEKYYVGSTKQNPKKRWNNGRGYKNQPKMWKDIQESDWNKDWVHGILGKFENKKDALNYEAFLIAMLGSIENGYNTSAYDSNHYKKTEDTRNKMSKAKTGNHNRPQKSVLQFSKDGEFIAEYPSIIEASRQTGCNLGHICSCCKEKLKSAGGFIWRYAS